MIDFSNLPFEVVVRAYQKFLQSAYNYYYDEYFNIEMMTDDMWTGLGFYYKNHLDKLPYLEEINFEGNTMGVGLSKEKLYNECLNPRVIN